MECQPPSPCIVGDIPTYGVRVWYKILFCFIFSLVSRFLCKSAAICIFFTLGWQWFSSCSSEQSAKASPHWRRTKWKIKCSDVDETKLIITRRRDTTFMGRKWTLVHCRRAACTFYFFLASSNRKYRLILHEWENKFRTDGCKKIKKKWKRHEIVCSFRFRM